MDPAPFGCADAQQMTLTLVFESTNPPADCWYGRKMDEMLRSINWFIVYQTNQMGSFSADLP